MIEQPTGNVNAKGRPMPMPDSFIAATARRHHLTIATRNLADYDRPGLKVADPTASLASGS